MSQQFIRWGILGTSPISATMANAIQTSDTGELTAIGSRSSAVGKQFADKFSIPKVHTSYQDLIEDNEIDAVYIGLPNHLHKEWTLRAAKAGKHILCEKPFVISVEEAREVISTVDAAGVYCLEALMYLHHPFTKKLQELIKSKMIGDIKLYVATYTANIANVANPTAGGAIRNLGCYPISLITLLANADPIEIIGTGRGHANHNNDHQASVILKFNDQSIATVSTADDIDMSSQLDIYGTNGCLKVLTNPWLPTLDNNRIMIKRHKEEPIEINVTAEKSLYSYQIDTVGTQLLKQNPVTATLENTLRNTIILETWRSIALASLDMNCI